MSRSILVCPDCKTPVSPKVPNSPAWKGNSYTCPSCRSIMNPSQFKTIRDMTIARGGGAPLGGQGPTGLSRVAVGTTGGTSSGASITLFPGVALGSGNALAVFILNQPGGVSSNIATMTWNGQPMTAVGNITTIAVGSSAFFLDAFVIDNATAGSGDVVLDLSVTGALDAWRAFATKIVGQGAVSQDRSKSSGGTSASPTSTATLATLASEELLIGCIAWAAAAISGAWSNSFIAGQSASDAAAISIEEGFRAVSAKGTYTAAKTGATNTDWAAGIVTFRQG